MPAAEATDADTRRYDVEQPTWTPTLFEPPIPPSVLHELDTTRYTKRRRWHEDEYVRMRVLEDVRATWYAARTLQSPLERMREEAARRAAQTADEIMRAGLSAETAEVVADAVRSSKLSKLQKRAIRRGVA